MANTNKGYIIIKLVGSEEDLISLKDILDEEDNDAIVSVNEQGEKLVIALDYDNIEDVAEIASIIAYTCISINITSFKLEYCGKESRRKEDTSVRQSSNLTQGSSNINTGTNTSSKRPHNNLSSSNSRDAAFNSYISGSFTT